MMRAIVEFDEECTADPARLFTEDDAIDENLLITFVPSGYPVGLPDRRATC